MVKTIGILGGMGPLATLDLFENIIYNSKANVDQDHLPIIIFNNPQIPSRVKAYFEGSEELISELKKSALLLERAGANFIIMPCHSAHIWIEEIQKIINIPIYSMVKNTALYIQSQEDFNNCKILLLATSATIFSQIYQRAFQSSNIRLVIPNSKEQAVISSLIAQVKAGNISNNIALPLFNEALNRYKEKGIFTILGACTEIPLLFPLLDEDLIKINPTLLLAKLAIRKAQEDFHL